MKRSKFNALKKQHVSSNFLANFLLANIALLLLFCLPINQFDMELSGLQRPSITFSFFLIVVMVMLSSWEISRQQQLRFSPFTRHLLKSVFLALIPIFYMLSNSEQVWQQSTNLLLICLAFISLQQFNFTLRQHQFFLLLPIIATWIFSVAIIGCYWFWQAGSAKILILMTDVEQSLGVLLLTATALSAYLLVREQKHKKFNLTSIMLLLTPFLAVGTLSLLSNIIYLLLGCLIVILSQAFLFRYGQRLQHALWLFSFIFGASSFLFAKENLLDLALFSSTEWLNVKETLKIFIMNPISGIGIGQLNNQLLLAKMSQGIDPTSYYSSPSWLLKVITEGGLIVAVAIISLASLFLKSIYHTSKGSRMMFLSILVPSFYALTFTPYTQLNPLLPLLLVMLFYWIDSLSIPYQKLEIKNTSSLALINRAVFTASVFLASSSIFLSYQALQVDQLTMKELEQYQKHPWWHDYFYSHYLKRQFLASFAAKDVSSMYKLIASQRMMLSTNPTADGYQALIQMADMMEDFELAEQNLREASRLFPSYRFFLK